MGERWLLKKESIIMNIIKLTAQEPCVPSGIFVEATGPIGEAPHVAELFNNAIKELWLCGPESPSDAPQTSPAPDTQGAIISEDDGC